VSGVSWKRALVGGAVAGLAYNAGGIVSAWLIGLPEAFVRFGVEPSPSTAVLHVGLRFGFGLASVLLYAGARGGWGGGPRTAAVVGSLVWLVGYVPGSTVLYEIGVLTGGQLGFALVWGLGEAVGSTLLGARSYGRDGGAHGGTDRPG